MREIARILKPGGHYLMIECFNDGLANNNRAREELGAKRRELLPKLHVIVDFTVSDEHVAAAR